MDTQEHTRTGFRPSGRIFLGLLILFLGVVWTLDNFGLADVGQYEQYWPAIIILFGLSRLLVGGHHADRLWGVFWTGVGTWLLLENLDVIDYSIWRLWPVFFVFLGLSILVRSVRGTRIPPGTDPGNRLSAFAVLSGADRKYTSQAFQGGEATAILGGCEIDLRQAQLAPGGAVVDLFAVWGGIDLTVPGDWAVKDETVAILGATSDARKQTAGDPAKVLILRGYAIMGGIEIKN